MSFGLKEIKKLDQSDPISNFRNEFHFQEKDLLNLLKIVFQNLHHSH